MSVSIDLDLCEVLSYAMAHNQVPVVNRIGVRNDGADLLGATIAVEIRDETGLVSLPWSVVADLPAGGALDLKDVPALLDPAAMLQVLEQQHGRVVATVAYDGQPVSSAEQPVVLLPGNHWRAEPPGLAAELLAAFVQPNDPAIGELLKDASDVLVARTGSPSLEGYQSGPERVEQIVAAIWEAAKRRGIRYAEPPASWGAIGQKVRSPGVVLGDRIGTCLDTTLLLAAALEQAGVRPLLWLLDGHSFLGYWKVETALDAIAYADAAEVTNAIDVGQMGLLETTALTAAPTPVPFHEAQRAALQRLAEPDQVLAVVDVWVARHHRVFPLPVRRQTATGVEIHEYRPASDGDLTVVVPPRPDAEQQAQRKPAPPRIQQWKNHLLDLSLRNRLINYSTRSGVRLAVPPGRLGTLEDLVSAGKRIALRPSDQLDSVDLARGVQSGAQLPPERLDRELAEKQALYTDVTGAAYQNRMRNLAYKARTVIEETGANNLYLALGSLSWKLDGRPLTSPLVLVPVTLVSARGQLYRIELDETGVSTPNYCLLEKLRLVDGLQIPTFESTLADEAGLDLDAVLQSVRVAIADRGLPYRVEETADLAILQFAKYRLWKDLDESWEALTANSLVHHLVHTPTQEYVDPAPAPHDVDLDELDALCPVPADGSQLAAVAEAVAGRTFVLEGPPGTGKSQTITNLLTRAVAEGKRVAFVAEKRAALDVVQSRLEAVGMGPFSLDLHDRGSKPSTVRAQIRAAMDHTVELDEQGLALHQDDLRASRRTLTRYAQRLHEPNGAGLSYYSARTQLVALGTDRVRLEVPTGLLAQPERLESVRNAVRLLADTAEPARPGPDHPWLFVRNADPAAVDRIAAAARAVEAALAAPLTDPTARSLVDLAGSPRDLRLLADLANRPTALPDLDETRTPRWRRESQRVVAEIAGLVSAPQPAFTWATPNALALPLGDIDQQARQAAESFWFGRKKRLRAVLDLLFPGLRPDVDVPPKQVPQVTAALLQLQATVQHLGAQASALPGGVLPPGWNPFTPQGASAVTDQVRWLTWVGDAVAPSSDAFRDPLRRWLATGTVLPHGDPQALAVLAAAWRELAAAAGAGDEELARWSGGGLVRRWAAGRDQRQLGSADQLPLRRWLAFNAALNPLTDAGLTEAADQLRRGDVHHDEAERALGRGIAAASLVERAQTTGLDGFDHLGHDRSVQRFVTSAKEVRGEMARAVPAGVIASRTFDVDAARGQVGELRRELQKQRRALGVRRLMEKYGDLITQLMPCVLVSPDSVARFFPVGTQLFDIVVFDEASQIRVADAVGAMGRARSVVVVGDSKQMPPTSFGEVSLDGDDAWTDTEDAVVEDAESILSEAVAAQVPQRWLTWHYRSQDESLIAFSNAHYYDHRLSSFPAPPPVDGEPLAAGRGISLVRVDGTFHRSAASGPLRTNPVEAEAIVADLRARFAAAPDRVPSVGVVTFNAQQRAYVEGLIRDSGDTRMIDALDSSVGEGLFVKNLENVQGDERDVILFSTAFSVNAKGVLPLNFGPLTRSGGERRLNVAITRARRQVVLYSSFDPDQLRIEETQSVGIRHLRNYLELAKQGAENWARTTTPRLAVVDRHREELADRLRSAGLVVSSDVGLSEFRIDLTLAHPEAPDEPAVAVLLDGPGWAARRTTHDRDGLPREVLAELMHWRAVERVWMPTWLSRPDEVIAHLREVIDRVHRGEETATVEPIDPEGFTPYVAPPIPATEPTDDRAFRPFVPTHRGTRDNLDAQPGTHPWHRVQAVITEVIEQEGPVHFDRLARLVAACFDLTRLADNRIQQVVAMIPPEMRPPADAEPFAWPVGVNPATWTAYRTGGDRPLEHLSLVEIANAMADIARAAAGIGADDLDREAIAVFGGKRLTAGIAARLAAARDYAVATRRLRLDDTGLHQATSPAD